ncbi:hypothetical protein [Streptomyces sp. NPDC093089]|uniref:hypothetical protein n=1 Tax=Streptomyces sp. NPDC093089 TaxID=3366024 RepID=UPI0037F3BC5A
MRALTRPRTHRTTRTTRSARTAVAALLCAAVAVGAAACGPSADEAKAKPAGPFGELTGSQVVDKAFAATKTAKSLTVDVDVRSPVEPMKAYLSLDTGGKCAGTLTMGAANTAELIKVDDKNVYLRFDEAFLREQVEEEGPEAQDAMVKELKGRWLKSSASEADSDGMLALCDLDELLDGFEQGATDIEKGAETTVDGQPALALTEPGDAGETSTVYVATEGTPYILKIVTKGGEEPGTIAFSHYGKPVDAKAPAAKDVVAAD